MMVFNHYEEERERRNDKKEREEESEMKEGVVESVHWMTLHFWIQTCSSRSSPFFLLKVIQILSMIC